MAKYTIANQFRLNVMNYEDLGFNGAEQLEGYLYKTDDISLLEYPNLFNYLEQYFTWYSNKAKAKFTFVVDEKTYKANTYLSYTIYQTDRFEDKHYVGFGEIIITDEVLPNFECYE